MDKLTLITSLAIVGSTLAPCSTRVEAAPVTINVDFSGRTVSSPAPTPAGLYTRSGAAPDNGGTTWNDVLGDNGTSGALVTSTGLATVKPVTVTLSGVTAAVDGSDFQHAGFAPALLNDYACVNTRSATTGTVSIAGLSAGGRYDLYLYSQNQGNASSTTVFNFPGSGTKTSTTTGNAVAANAGFTQDVNYVVYTGITADSSGIISGTFTTGRPDEDNGVLNGFQLVGDLAVVPKP